ncbi:hypothetical protein K501DRAFT_283888 [Backusella circina FSU 941]|nr:hypothetical protein K501DRAFT_283888 [Backusella circina FSU 941]
MNQRQLYEQYTDNLLDSVFQNARYAEPNMFGNQWQQQESGLHSVPIHTKSPAIEEQQPRSPIVARKSVQSPTPQKMSVVRKKVPAQETATTTKTRKKKRIIKKIIYEQASETEDDDDESEEEEEEEQVERRGSRNKQNKHSLKNISHTNNIDQTDAKPPVTRKSLRNTLIRRKKPAKPKAQEILQDDSYTQQQQQQHKVFVDDTPSFWRPRETRAKGWWKGNRAPSKDQQDEQHQSGSISKKDKKVASSIKSRRAARPMAFKTPQRKNKVSGSNSASTTTTAAAQNNYTLPISSQQQVSTPIMAAPQMMYAMPQMFPQQTLFPQQMLSQFSQPLPFGQPSPMYYHPQPAEPAATTNEDESKNKKRTTIYNPREVSHDKCCIM